MCFLKNKKYYPWNLVQGLEIQILKKLQKIKKRAREQLPSSLVQDSIS